MSNNKFNIGDYFVCKSNLVDSPSLVYGSGCSKEYNKYIEAIKNMESGVGNLETVKQSVEELNNLTINLSSELSKEVTHTKKLLENAHYLFGKLLDDSNNKESNE
tara:strand:+ start:1089 stop:1403 length:315 start_codon:yes stop_codon:yes gene_type:complete